jgi:hypothetical protein
LQCRLGQRGLAHDAYTALEKPLAVKFVFAEARISSGTVLDKIISMIEEADFGIYDVTGWNPNVTLEYGVARGMGAPAFVAFNPDRTEMTDVPTDVRGYDRLQYSDFNELSEAIATLVAQELGPAPRSEDPLESDRQRLLGVIRTSGGMTARELAELTGERIDYVQLLLRRSEGELRTEGRTRGLRYYPKS